MSFFPLSLPLAGLKPLARGDLTLSLSSFSQFASRNVCLPRARRGRFHNPRA